MKTVHAALALGVLLIGGCTTNPDGTTSLGEPGSPMWLATASRSAIADHYRSTCLSYGHGPGSPGLAQCIGEETRSRARHADATYAQMTR